jgi:septal ring-binding cell division protein DamX
MVLVHSAAALLATGCSSYSTNTATPGNYTIQVTGTGATTDIQQYQNVSLTITK